MSKDSKEMIQYIDKYCKEHISNDSIPVVYKILDKFPVKASGKRDMEKLRLLLMEEHM